MSVGVGASQRIPLFWHETPTKGLRARFPTRPEEDEGRQETDQSTQQNKTVYRTGESVEQGSRQKRAGTRACGLRGQVGQSERISQRSWWLCGNFARIHTHASSQKHRKQHKSVTNFSLLALGANPSLCLFVLFSSALSVVYVVFCVSVKKCEIPLAGDERNH